VYLEPPTIHRHGASNNYLPKDDSWLFSAYIPLHRANRGELAPEAFQVPRSGFVIRQLEASNFYFYFLNHQATAIAEYHFRLDEGDFECHDGHIEFPTLSSYGMIEGRSVNFQVRNVLLTDETDALVIQSTRGPFRGSPPEMERSLMYEFIRYPRKDYDIQTGHPASRGL
jgi:hypothetical protein